MYVPLSHPVPVVGLVAESQGTRLLNEALGTSELSCVRMQMGRVYGQSPGDC